MDSNRILVSERQRGNGLLQFIKNVPWEFIKDIVPDYIVGTSNCLLFISLKYHILHPMYLHRRIKELRTDFKLRIVLALVDTEDNTKPILELNKICFSSNFTLFLAWTIQEAARYVETLKAYENKSTISIQEKEETEFLPKITKVFTNIKSVNKTDVVTILEVFHNFKGICSATEEQLMLCPGLGEKKVRRLYQSIHESFHQKKRLKTVTNTSKSIYDQQEDDIVNQNEEYHNNNDTNNDENNDSIQSSDINNII